MINPVIFSFKLIYWTVTLRWYGLLVMFGAIVGAWWADKEIRRRGENGEVIWDAMVWVLPIGIIGARVWYVVNNILGGGTYYLDNPIKMLYVWEGGLHIFGGFLFGLIVLYIFLKRNGLDAWLFLDALAPATLLGQALARPANYINQELYGPPTKLPWGIMIQAEHRLPQFSDLTKFPVDTTRFHPTFLYEMILNILIVLFLWWVSRRYEEKLKPGALFSTWLILAGLSRSFIEFFRPDQPRIGNTFISYTMVVAFLMAVIGLIMLLARYGKIKLAWAENWEEEYHIKKVEKKAITTARPVTAAPLDASTSINKKVISKTSSNAVLEAGKKKIVAKKAAVKKPAPKKVVPVKKPATNKKTVTTKRKTVGK